MSSTFIENSPNPFSSNTNTIHEEEEQQQGNEQQQQQTLSNHFTRKCSIDIHGKSVSNDILVALLDRPVEMKQLAARNSQFYEAIENYITETQGNFAWQKFQDIVYKPREKLPDRTWINQISQFLAHNQVFLTKFKESVGYEDDEEDVNTTFNNVFVPPPHKLSSSTSTGSIGSNSNGRRKSRRMSSVSLDFTNNNNDNDVTIEEEAPKVPEGMFANEDQFYHQRRRRSSYHSIQSEPHPTFVESKIDEVDEAEIEDSHNKDDNGNESDHLADLLDTSSDDEDDDNNNHQAGISTSQHQRSVFSKSKRNDMDLIKLRDYPEFQANLPYTHPKFFQKAKQLLSLAPSSHHFSATIRRNSILEDAMPPSPVTELDEPRFQTCLETDEEDTNGGKLTRLVCCTRRQQPDDIAWLNGVMESLAGWPDLVDRLQDIINESLAE